MVVKAWKSLFADLIQKSFVCCGQIQDITSADIYCFKGGCPATEGCQQLSEFYVMPTAELARLTATQDDDADDELDVDALVLAESGIPSLGDPDEASSSDDGSGNELIPCVFFPLHHGIAIFISLYQF